MGFSAWSGREIVEPIAQQREVKSFQLEARQQAAAQQQMATEGCEPQTAYREFAADTPEGADLMPGA